MKSLVGLAALSIVLLGVRLFAAMHIGFGDAEALYATYALHPQPLYVDHPGLVGFLARAIGGGTAPSPLAAHVATSIACTLVPWAGVVAARLAGVPWARAARAGWAMIAAPEIAIGLFGLTPDLPLSLLWIGALGLAAFAVRAREDDPRVLLASLGAGACAGLACTAKASGVLLCLVLLATWVRTRRPAGTGPWLGAAIALVLVSPVVSAELLGGLPMLKHRLVDTQAGAGLSLRNAGALIGGQLAYLSPVLAVGAAVVAVDLVRRARGSGREPLDALLVLALLVPLVPLSALCLWSRVAEPHWIAPAFLPLAIHVARMDRLPPWTSYAAPTGLAATLAVHVWVLTELAPRHLGRLYEPRYDLATDLFAWRRALPAIASVRARVRRDLDMEPVIVAAHWTLAAQIAAGLRDANVTTTGAESDDFRRWIPPASWDAHPAILWVTDDRFPGRAAPMKGRARAFAADVEIERGGRAARVIRIEVWVLHDDSG